MPAVAVLSACAPWAGSGVPAVEPEAAWVQADADGVWSVRALTAAADCPVLQWDGGSMAMHTRAAPGQVAPRPDAVQSDTKPAAFPARSCQASWPQGAGQVRLGARLLKRPVQDHHRIVLIGDTGCRLKASERAFQDCNDAQAWPFARVAQLAAALSPDLVVHVGDLHYRESPCPADRAGCAGSPWGYGQDTWMADLFRPAAPLLAAAPWVFVRGNHESCGRAGAGWFRYLDAHAWSARAACEQPADDAASEFTEPFAVALSDDTQLIVFDSSFAAGKAYPEGHPAAQRYAAQLKRVEELARARPHNVFVNHHPVLGFGGSASGQPKPGHAGLYSVMVAMHPQQLYAPGVDLVLNGHVHLYQALGFASGHPGTVVTGNGGSMMEGVVDPAQALRQQPVPGAVVEVYDTQPGFGFAVLEREADGWRLTERAVDGRVTGNCLIRGRRLSCSAPVSR